MQSNATSHYKHSFWCFNFFSIDSDSVGRAIIIDMAFNSIGTLLLTLLDNEHILVYNIADANAQASAQLNYQNTEQAYHTISQVTGSQRVLNMIANNLSLYAGKFIRTKPCVVIAPAAYHKR